jgi:calcineurin-like phosphoesterase family protein
MLGRLAKWAGILLGAALASPQASTAASAPAPRIIAVGDLHGDYSAWMDIAHAAGLVDAGNHWAAGKTVLVQLGDITDRGPDSLKIVRHLQQLQAEAPRAGGQVFVILGNHEAMNLLGDFRYTTPGEYAAFVDARSPARREQLYMRVRGELENAARRSNPNATPSQVRAGWLAQTPLGWVEHRDAWSPRGDLGRWASRNSAIGKVGDTLFAHGGISAEYAKLPLSEVNRRVAVDMRAGKGGAGSTLEDPLGPLWYRGLAGGDPDAAAERAAIHSPILPPDQELSAVLAAYGAKRLIIAHTPSLAGIVISPDSRLARIDTGISRYYGGPVSWLEIIGDRMIPHTVRRSGL